MADGRLGCIGGLSLGDGPLNARGDLPDGLDFEHEGLSPGESARIAGAELLIGESYAFGLEDAETWRPPPAPPTPSNDALTGGLEKLRRGAGAVSHDIGLGRLISDGPAGADGSDLVLERAVVATSALTHWFRHGLDGPAAEPPPAGCEALIGLGAGLTPSGDDWIGGALIALGTLGMSETARLLAGWVLPLALARTGKISIAHLAAAAGGEGAAALHDAIHAVCRDDGAKIEAALVDIDAIGHSSGWDALAGAAAVLSSRCGSPM